MGLLRLSTSTRTSQLRKWSIPFSSGIILCFIVFSLLLLNIPVQATSYDHGCAPDTPPPAPGNPVTPPAQAGIIVINEALPNPASLWNCSALAGNTSLTSNSWLELYNPQSTPFDLYPTHTQISIDGGTNWYHFPQGTSIAAYGFLVLFPEEKLQPAPSWNLILTMGNTLIDTLQVPILNPDQSYARVLDGSRTWVSSNQPTIDASNDSSVQALSPTPTSTSASSSTPAPTSVPTARASGATRPANTPANTGTQPAWNKLQLPSSTQIATLPPRPVLNQSMPVPAGTTPDAWHIVLFIALLLLLSGALTWCWRLFRTP
ncbi:MAG TPA: hypothetical protein VFV38_33785 [Ktedonobacteraceae bacterium]|nr:hypothetical protein [Ktedonobacteraceae bacterium]